MPTETVVAVVAILCAFALFGIVLAWADMQTRNLPQH
jgi:hypothetical protein